MKQGDRCEYASLEKVFQTLPKEQILIIDIKDAGKIESCLAMRQLIDKYGRHETTAISTTSLSYKNIDAVFKDRKKPLISLPV